MNSKLMITMPVVALALGLNACGKNNSETKPTVESAPAITATKIDTAYEADCGGQPSAAVAGAFDLTSCQLNGQQKALVRSVGPIKVEADCTQMGVRVKNAAGEISGQGSIEQDGTYNVELVSGESFQEVEGCPINLAGRATGTVTCKDGKVEGVTVNTSFNLSNSTPTEAVAAAAVEMAAFDPERDRERDRQWDRERDHDRDDRHIPPKGGVIVAPKAGAVVKGGVIAKGKEVPIIVGKHNRDERREHLRDHDRDRDRDEHHLPPKGGVIVKGAQIKGGQRGEHHWPRRADSCVAFSPCVFNSSAKLSCVGIAPAISAHEATAAPAPAVESGSAPTEAPVSAPVVAPAHAAAPVSAPIAAPVPAAAPAAGSGASSAPSSASGPAPSSAQ